MHRVRAKVFTLSAIMLMSQSDLTGIFDMRTDCELIDKAVRIEKRIARLTTVDTLSCDEILSDIAAELGYTAAPLVCKK
jgi:hypothetical protein